MSREVLARHFEELKDLPNVLNANVSTKIEKGKNTGIPSITVYVSKKVPCETLPAEHCIPPQIEGVPTDVVEIAPTTWRAGKTEISQLPPDEQLRRLGANKPPFVLHNAMATKPTFSQVSDLRKWANPTRRDQTTCGKCVGEGVINTTEGKYKIQVNNPLDPIRLSVDDAFFCSGGTCDEGHQVPAILDWLVQNYVCTETCQPTNSGDDIACGAGRCAAPWIGARKLKSWTVITDVNQMKALLDGEPLICVMAVHQSFFNYVSGIYKSLGPSDPIVGYHCTANWGHNESGLYWGPIENSWGLWGEEGFFRIAFGDSEIDQQMWKVEVDLNPVPAPLGIYVINITAGAHGSISPDGPVKVVNSGETVGFSFIPDAGYQIADVQIDGVSQGPVGTFTFNNIQADHTVSATFVPVPVPPPPPPLPPPDPLTITTNSLPTGVAGVAYGQTLVAAGGVQPYFWAVLSGLLPVGLSFSSQGVISGTPTTAGTLTFIILVADSNHTNKSQTLSITINAPAPPPNPPDGCNPFSKVIKLLKKEIKKEVPIYESYIVHESYSSGYPVCLSGWSRYRDLGLVEPEAPAAV